MHESRSAVARSATWLPGFAAVMIVSVLVRVAVAVTSRPVVDGDAPGYLEFARLIWHGHMVAFQGKRTPGYSVFLILHAFNPEAVRLTQFALGLAVTAGLFFVLWQLTHSPWVTAIGAALYSLNVGHIYFESTLYAELLATFFLVLALVLLVSLRRSNRHEAAILIVLGLTIGILPLVRPLYVYLPLLLSIPVFMALKGRRRRFWLYVLPALIPVAMWMGYLYANYDYVGLQTVSGFGWTNHAGAFMRDAPDRYGPIRDIYLREVAAQDGVWTNAIWPAIPDMERATGESYPELSKTVQRLSLGLLWNHPFGYARQVATAFVEFWKGSFYHPVWGRPFGGLTYPAWKLTFYIAVVVSGWFCMAVVWMGVVFLRTGRRPRLPWPCLWLAITVLVTAVVQAVTEYGSATRFGMPTFPYVIVVAACAFDFWLLKRSGGDGVRFEEGAGPDSVNAGLK